MEYLAAKQIQNGDIAFVCLTGSKKIGHKALKICFAKSIDEVRADDWMYRYQFIKTDKHDYELAVKFITEHFDGYSGFAIKEFHTGFVSKKEMISIIGKAELYKKLSGQV